jgi:hypothetical protein
MRAFLLLLPALALPACIWVADTEVDERFAELTDADGDGYQDVAFGGDDCDDSDPAVHPAGTEVCNGVDDDCSGSADDELEAPWYPDGDGDGFGDAGGMSITCEPQSGWVDNGDDCDDGSDQVSPDADEYCNGIDDDCDDETDEEDAEDASTFFEDADGDGFGDVASFAIACDPPTSFVDDATDCDDSDDAVYPDADEYCNGIDDDCDGDVDEDDALDASSWYADDDGDGFGDADSPATACEEPDDHVSDDSDCDDGDDAIHPGGLEALGDEDDGDCDGDADSFGFALHDTRSSQDLVGPRLDQGGGEVYLVWAAEELDDGGTIYDAVAVSIFDDEDPLAGEQDFQAEGEPSNLAILGHVDLVASDTLFVVGSSWIDKTSRDIRLDAFSSSSGATGRYTYGTDWVVPFDQMQLGLSALGNVTAVGCGQGGAGLQALQVSAANVVGGTAVPSVEALANDAVDDHDTCEYDHLDYRFYMGNSVVGHLDYYAFDFDSDTLYSTQSAAGSYDLTDEEVTTAHGSWVWAFSDLDSTDRIFLAFAEDSDTSNAVVFSGYTSEPVMDLDVGVSPDGIVYLCGVQDDGDASLLWVDLGELSPVLASLELSAPDLGTIEQCAITVTADSVAYIALRSGDDLALATVQVP